MRLPQLPQPDAAKTGAPFRQPPHPPRPAPPALRAACDEEELRIASIQNELAKLQVDVLNTEAHNGRLTEALALLEAELKDKARPGGGRRPRRAGHAAAQGRRRL